MDYLWIYLLFALFGVLVTILGIPMKLRKIKPNGLYGFRTKKTLENETVWYKANEYSGGLMIVTGIVITVASIILYFLTKPMNLNTVALLLLSVSVVPIVVMIILSIRKLNTL